MVAVDGVHQTVRWTKGKHRDGPAKIVSVESEAQGIVELDGQTKFENPAELGRWHLLGEYAGRVMTEEEYSERCCHRIFVRMLYCERLIELFIRYTSLRGINQHQRYSFELQTNSFGDETVQLVIDAAGSYGSQCCCAHYGPHLGPQDTYGPLKISLQMSLEASLEAPLKMLLQAIS